MKKTFIVAYMFGAFSIALLAEGIESSINPIENPMAWLDVNLENLVKLEDACSGSGASLSSCESASPLGENLKQKLLMEKFSYQKKICLPFETISEDELLQCLVDIAKYEKNKDNKDLENKSRNAEIIVSNMRSPKRHEKLFNILYSFSMHGSTNICDEVTNEQLVHAWCECSGICRFAFKGVGKTDLGYSWLKTKEYTMETGVLWWYVGHNYAKQIWDEWYSCWKKEQLRKKPRPTIIDALAGDMASFLYFTMPCLIDNVRKGDKTLMKVIECCNDTIAISEDANELLLWWNENRDLFPSGYCGQDAEARAMSSEAFMMLNFERGNTEKLAQDIKDMKAYYSVPDKDRLSKYWYHYLDDIDEEENPLYDFIRSAKRKVR